MDGWLNRRNKAVFSNFSGAVWTARVATEEKNVS